MMPPPNLAPMPYFGGKAIVAPIVWRGLGDVGHYVEPFCGSAAVLLARPDYDQSRHVETVNDADGHIANVWRSLQSAPDEVAKWCDWPVNHADLMARKRRLNEATGVLLERLAADDTYYDPLLAGYYIWAASCWIGHGLVCPTQIPHLADTGKGVHRLAESAIVEGGDVRDPYTPGIYEWFRQLSERLRRVRVVCGDWSRVCGGNWQDKPGKPVGIFFDPPYSETADRDERIYSTDSLTVAHAVREWCRRRADRRDHRIVLAGYYEEHESLLAEGWTVYRWSANGGYGRISENGQETRAMANRHKEALFMSPHCLPLERQPTMFDLVEVGVDD